jgi:hypothetical protein
MSKRKIDTTLQTYFTGLQNNPDKNSFHGMFSLLRYLMDPIFITSMVKEIQLSPMLHDLLLEYINSYAGVTFSVVTHFCTIPVYINNSFENDRLELHYSDKIIMEKIQL